MNIVCPRCHEENAYGSSFTEIGAVYSCPDCDNEWTVLYEIDEDDELDFEAEDFE
jgi:transposase-like protein